MDTAEVTFVNATFRIPPAEKARLQEVADELYEGNLGMLIRRSLREFLARVESESETETVAA